MKPLALAVLLLSSWLSAQQSHFRSDEARLDKSRPTVYLAFDSYTERDGFKDVRLRLCNNSPFGISFLSMGTSDQGTLPLYRVRTTGHWELRKGGSRWVGPKPPLYGAVEDVLLSRIHVKPGQNMLVLVPRETLAKGLWVDIPFNYEWEGESLSLREPDHFVSFFPDDLPEK